VEDVVAVAVDVAVCVVDGDAVAVEVAVALGVAVQVLVGDGVGVGLGVPVGVAVAVGVMALPQLSPELCQKRTPARQASKAASPGSHRAVLRRSALHRLARLVRLDGRGPLSGL
jgi:hypothetical protein